MIKTATDYVGIEAWGRYLGSTFDYIESQQNRAMEEDAPIDSIYKHSSGRWVTVEEVPAESSFHARYGRALEANKLRSKA